MRSSGRIDDVTGHQCYHCKQWVDEGEAHDCWTTTEAALTRHLSQDLQDAYERLRETAIEFGEQRIYASHNSIMFARKACYFFVRPKLSFLEVCMFLGRLVKAPQVKTTAKTSKVKIAHIVKVRHRDEVEAPLTDWLREAYQLQDVMAAPSSTHTTPVSSKPGGARLRTTKRKTSKSATATPKASRSKRALAPAMPKAKRAARGTPRRS